MIARGRVSPLRVCDKCGAQRPAATMRVISGHWICDWHDKYISSEAHDKRPVRKFVLEPFKGARPFAPRETLQRSEDELLSFLEQYYSTDCVDITSGPIARSFTGLGHGVMAAAWTAIYCYGVITENRRPVSFVNRARALLRTCADFLLGVQFRDAPTAEVYYGGFAQGSPSANPAIIDVRLTASGGLALLRAYQVHGTADYLTGSRAAAWACRTLQCGGKLFIGASSSDSAGVAIVQHGAFTLRVSVDVNVGIGEFDHFYALDSLIALEFLQAFRTVVGDESIGSAAPDSGLTFVVSRACLVSESVAEALAFWKAGVFDTVGGATITGLSSSTPRQAFNSYPAAGKYLLTGTGSWEFADAGAATGVSITGLGIATAIRALRSLEGDSALVTGLFDWLMGFSSESTLEVPAAASYRLTGWSDKKIYETSNGAYEPTFALAPALRVREGTPLAAASKNYTPAGYMLAATGLLAELYASRKPADFAAFKKALARPRPYSVDGAEDGRHAWLGTMGTCGLSLQPRTAVTGDQFDSQPARAQFPHLAAMTGLAYRAGATAFMHEGRA